MEISDPLFREAVEAIDSGDIKTLENMLRAYPNLVRDRLDDPDGGYFKNPYLLWFVADNPIRIDKLAGNIVEVTRLLIDTVKREAAGSAQEQLDYALGLVATGRIPRECGVQIPMMDLLIDAGAKPGGGKGALAHGNVAAAEHLIKRGGRLTLATAVGLGRLDDVRRMLSEAPRDEQLTALTVAAFYGNTAMIELLLSMGIDPNGYPGSNSGFHSHATPLHQAVSSNSAEAVKLLAEAGASLDARDKIYDGTPYDWADYMRRDENFDEATRKNFKLIAEYLEEKNKAT
ncbi:MAG: ankyrin repeat domain-containing protein [Mucilaginibacter sp.]